MAIQALNADRRSFLAAGMATVVAVSVAAPAVAANPRAEWDAAMARYNKAEAAHNRYAREVDSKYATPMPRDVIEEDDRLGNIVSDCEDALIRTPAPDRQALRWKLEYIMQDSGLGEINPYTTEYLAQTMADVARLLGDA